MVRAEARSWRRWRRQGRGGARCGQCMRWRASCRFRRWTSFYDHAATSPAVLFRSSFSTSGWCLSFSSSTECFFLVVNRDRYDSCFGWSSSWTRLLSVPGLCNDSRRCVWVQYIDKVVDVHVVARFGCSMEACVRISKNCLVLLALDVISRAPCFWQPPAPVRCDSPRRLLGEFLLFST